MSLLRILGRLLVFPLQCFASLALGVAWTAGHAFYRPLGYFIHGDSSRFGGAPYQWCGETLYSYEDSWYRPLQKRIWAPKFVQKKPNSTVPTVF